MTTTDKVRQAAKLIRQSQRPVVLTGAGVSKESGVPTFRDAMDGLWSRYDPGQLATPEAFTRDPELVWEWYEYRRDLVRRAAPNPGHLALAELEQFVPGLVIITQNVDDLHQRAGSTDIVPLHGAIMQSKCYANCQGDPTLVDLTALQEPAKTSLPPRCPYCGAWVRPDVVWFGETLPPAQLSRAMHLAEQTDLMLVVGTSGVVQPAASLPYLAAKSGAKIIEVNPDYSGITQLTAVWLEGPSGELLPQVIQALQELSG